MLGLILILIQVALFVASALLQKGPKGPRAKALGDFSFPTADETRAVPVVWGTVDIRGPNVIWDGNLRVHALTMSTGGFFGLGGSDVVTAYQYFVGMDLLLCYGPIDRVTRLEVSDRPVKNFPTSIDVQANGGAGVEVVLNAQGHLGGKNKGGGLTGRIRIFPGVPDQGRDAYLVRVVGHGNPDLIPAYVDIAHVVCHQIGVGESTSIGNYVFRVTRFPNNLGLSSNHHIVNGTISDGDANLAEVLYELLTSPMFGIGIDSGRIDIASFVAAGETLYEEGNGYSFVLASQKKAKELIDDIVLQMNAVLFEDATGFFRLKLVRDDFIHDSLVSLNDDNILEIQEFSRASWPETYNHYDVPFADRTKHFQNTEAMAQDLANFRTTAVENRQSHSFNGVTYPATATQIAERELRQVSYPFAKVKLVANRVAAKLMPGDAILFSTNHWDAPITNMVLRVLVVELGDISNGRVTLDCVEDLFRLSENIFADAAPSLAEDLVDDVEAFTIELVRDTPRIFLNLAFFESASFDPAEGEYVLSLAQAPNGSTAIFELWVDALDATGYHDVGSATATTPSATLVSDYPADTDDIEIGGSLVVTDLDIPSALEAATAAEIAAGANLAILQGPDSAHDEIIGWESITDNGDETFTLNNIHRGLMDTQARPFSAGDRIWFMSQGLALSSSAYGATDTVHVKNQPRIRAESLDLADATQRNLTFATRLPRPHHPADFQQNGIRWPLLGSTDTAPLAYTWGHRVLSDGEVFDADVASALTQDNDVQYDLIFKHDSTGATLRTATLTHLTTWTSYTYLVADIQSDTGEVGNFPLRVSMQARYDAAATLNPANLTSLQQLLASFNVDMTDGVDESVDLDGATEFLTNDTNNTLGVANVWSLEMWVKPRGSVTGSAPQIFVAKNGSNDNNRIDLTLTDTLAGAPFNLKLYTSAGTLFKDYDFGSYVPAGWTVLVATWDGTDLLVYQDGNLRTPTLNVDNAGTMTDTGRKITIGADPSHTSLWLDGLIYRTALWNAARSAASVVETNPNDTRNIRVNFGAYQERDNLKHLWDWRNTADIGADYGHVTSGKISFTADSATIDGADLSVDIPV